MSGRDRRRWTYSNPRQDERRAEADAREEARACRTPKEQLALLDARPGNSARERARLETEVGYVV